MNFERLDIFSVVSSNNLCPQVSKYFNILALDGSNWQKIDLFYFQIDIEVSFRCVFEALSTPNSSRDPSSRTSRNDAAAFSSICPSRAVNQLAINRFELSLNTATTLNI
jgi:hypothetical protein